MSEPRLPSLVARRVLAAAFLLASVLVFWKLRILDLGTNPRVELGPIDLYIEHVPMAQAASDALARGRLPLWNPYQLGGLPFLAIPHVGLFYPLHLLTIGLDAETAVELSFVLHMWLGAAGMWLLVRRLRMSGLAAAAAALTFAWSGWIVFTNVVPAVFAGLCWLPLTIHLLERAIDRERLAHLALGLAVACQILLGASEVLVHTMLVAAAWTAARLVQRAATGAPADAFRTGLSLLGTMAAACLLTAPQLLPSLELVAASGRGAEGPSAAAAAQGAIAPGRFLAEALGMEGLVSVGFLPLLALPLLWVADRSRFAAGMALGLAAVAALLVFGGPVYEAYHAIPGIGAPFRRPMKFLDVHAFAQALLAALAISGLEVLATRARASLLRTPHWLAAVALLVAAATGARWLGGPDARYGYWLAALALVVGLAALPLGRARTLALATLVALQAACLFVGAGGTHVRPVLRPEIYHGHDALLEDLRRAADHERVYLSDAFLAEPSLTPKQGTLAALRVATDYEPLAPRRSQRFFDLVSPGDQQRRLNPFAGFYALRPGTRWSLLDLTATRLLVMSTREPVTGWMRSRPSAFRPVAAGPGWQVFERPSALPRARLVADFTVEADEDATLAALVAPGFDPRREVLVDRRPSFEPMPTSAGSVPGRVAYVVDAPETVELAVSAPGPRLVVLADTDFPGWRAFVDEREVPILRANYLFRAVEIGPGDHVVRFEYAPQSFRCGLVLASGAVAAIVLAAVIGVRRGVTSR